MSNRSLIVSLFTALSAFAVSTVAQAGVVTAVPCAAKAKAVIANSGQAMHNSNTTVTGDVQAASTIIKNGNAVITGTQTQNAPARLAVVPVPATTTNLGNYVVSGTVTLPAGNYRANSFAMNPGSTLIISGGIAQIWVTGASLTLAGTANAGGDPTNLEFLVTSQQFVNVNTNSNITAFIYAPIAGVVVGGTVNGSVVGSSTTINGGGAVNFVAAAKCP